MTIEDFASQISLTLITTLNLPKTKCPAAKVSQGFISQNQDIHKIAPPSDVQLHKSISSSLLAVTNNLSPLVHYYEWLQREQHCHYTLTYTGTPSIFHWVTSQRTKTSHSNVIATVMFERAIPIKSSPSMEKLQVLCTSASFLLSLNSLMSFIDELQR